MIFTENDDSEKLLKESGSNWLVKATSNPTILSLDYLNKNNQLESVYLHLIEGIWLAEEELKTDGESQSNDNTTNDTANLNIDIRDTYEQLQVCIGNKLYSLYADEKKINWLWRASIRLIPAAYEKICYAKVTPSTIKLEFNINNWIHSAVLRNCLSDKRLYPYSAYYAADNSIYYIANNSSTIIKIRAELARLLTNTQSELNDSELNHPYYQNIQNAFAYRVKRIVHELSNDTLYANTKIIREYNQLEQSVKANTVHRRDLPVKETKELSDLFINDSKTVKNKTIKSCLVKLSNDNYASVAACQGGKPTQEDRAFIADNIHVDPIWQEKIPELLMYTVQVLFAEIYEKFSAETGEKSIGSTLTLVFIYNNKIYTLWLGDSPVIALRNSDNKATYLYCPHRFKQHPSSKEDEIPIIREQELARLELEGAKKVASENAIRVNNFLMVTRAIGDRCPGLGNGISDIPSLAIEDIHPDEKLTLIVGSDGLTDGLSLKDITEIWQNTADNELAQAFCNAAHRNIPAEIRGKKVTADNIIAVALSKCRNKTLLYVLDGHGQQNGHIVANYAQARLIEIFMQIAANKVLQAEQQNLNNCPIKTSSYDGFTFLNSMSSSPPPVENTNNDKQDEAEITPCAKKSKTHHNPTSSSPPKELRL
jgi:serine/threonine protein phosphatase PrpC